MNATRYRFAHGVRLHRDPARSMLLIPEGVLALNETAYAALELLDGARSAGEVTDLLRERFGGDSAVIAAGVAGLIDGLAARGVVVAVSPPPVKVAPPPPLLLLAEVTYRCNLQCPYCSNPLDLTSERELDRDSWLRVLQEAARLGVVQIGISGGEPTLRAADAVAMVARSAELGMYTNLITQGTFLDDALLTEFIAAGLDHVQISLQAPGRELAERIAGADVFERKRAAIRRVLRRDVAFTLNYVLHRFNHGTLAEITAFAEREGIRRLELANVQFYGWALRNRAALLPTPEQVEQTAELVARERERLRGVMEIVYVHPDYFTGLPKPCMYGWGRRALTVTPGGQILPCAAAASITPIAFPNVRESSLADAWYRSDAFECYRGSGWMPDPCRSCDRREIDWGGCRCQAFLLTGDAGATDPACAKSPHHGLMAGLRETANQDAFIPRRPGKLTANGIEAS